MRLLLSASLSLLAAVASAQGPDWFPFHVPAVIEPGSAVDLSGLNGGAIGAGDAVRVDPSGRLATIEGAPVFLMGMNLSFGANLPREQDAAAEAARIAALGFNCVRIHHLDSADAPSGVLSTGPNGRTVLDPAMLARLDRFAHELAQRGVYLNLNLHVGRQLGSAEGIPGGEDGPNYNKGVSQYHPGIAALQKDYARGLLDRVNPHAGVRWADWPAVAIVEITNENGLLYEAGRGSIDNSPPVLVEPLRVQWNDWLRERHGNHASMLAAWGAVPEPPGSEMLLNGGFQQGTNPWYLEQHSGAAATMGVIATGGPDGGPFLRVSTTVPGSEGWHVQVQQGGLTLVEGQNYELTFDARSPNKTAFSVNAMLGEAPWSGLGLSRTVPLTTQWSPHRLGFRASASTTAGRITLTGLGTEAGMLEVARVGLRTVGPLTPAAGESIDDGTLAILPRDDFEAAPDGWRNDWVEFLRDTEVAHGEEMKTFLRDELGVACPLVVTQVNFSPSLVQGATSDVVAHHVYTEHPNFPNIPWDQSDWVISNRSTSTRAGYETLGAMAAVRVAGKPFFIGELNQSSPNEFESEVFLLAALVAGHQGFDGLFPYTYGHSSTFVHDRITGFFDVVGNPGKLATLSVAARLLREGMVERSPSERVVRVGALEEAGAFFVQPWQARSRLRGVPPIAALVSRLAIAEGDEAPPVPALDSPITSDTGQLRWNFDDPERAFVTLDAPKAKVLAGFVEGQSVDLGGFLLEPGPTARGWSLHALVSADGQPLDQSRRMLLVTVAGVANTGMQWNAERTSIGTSWGGAPVLAEPVPLRLEFPFPAGEVTVHPLEGSGARREALPVEGDASAVVQLGVLRPSLWHEVLRSPANASLHGWQAR